MNNDPPSASEANTHATKEEQHTYETHKQEPHDPPMNEQDQKDAAMNAKEENGNHAEGVRMGLMGGSGGGSAGYYQNGYPHQPMQPQQSAASASSTSARTEMPSLVSPTTGRQMHFPYASSNFVAPMPTPIRPLHGDPRMGQAPSPSAPSPVPNAKNEISLGSSSNVTPKEETTNTHAGYSVPVSRMFHHQANSASFYNTQDSPVPAQGSYGPPTSSAPVVSEAAPAPSVPPPQVSTAQESPKDGGLMTPPFMPKELLPQRVDDQTYALDPNTLGRLMSYGKQVQKPGHAMAFAIDVLRGTLEKDPSAHSWRSSYAPNEYEILLQKGSIGLCMNMSVRMGCVSVTSFRRPADGIMGPAEASGVVKIGDDLIAVDGFPINSPEDFSKVVGRLKSLRSVLLRFRRSNASSIMSTNPSEPNPYRHGRRTSMAQLDNSEMFTTGLWHMGVRYISPNEWAAELHVDGGGVRRLGLFTNERDAAVAYNRYIHYTYGNGAVKFMNPAGTGPPAQDAGNAALPVAVSNVREVQPLWTQPRRSALRAMFTNEQKEQLRAQIMAFKFTAELGAVIPNDILARALIPTDYMQVRTTTVSRQKKRTFAEPVSMKGNKKNTKKGRRKKKYSDESEPETDSDEDFSAVPVKEVKQPTRRSGRNAGKAKKSYVAQENDSDFEFSEDEKVAKKQQQKEAEEKKGAQIDKIVAVRFHKETEDDDANMEFLIKWKNTSYLHLNWLSVDEVEAFGHSSIMRMRRHLQKHSRDVEQARENIVVGEEKDYSSYFSESYLEVDRIVGMKEVEEPVEVSPYNNHGAGEDGKPEMKRGKKYLVKWRDLSYVDCTWEWEDELTDDRKIAAYHRYIHPPMLNGAHPAMFSDIRPDPSTWAKYQESPVYNNQNTLRSYQLEGLNWMVFCWYNRRNCILADEMGLGKTVQATAILEHLRSREHIRGPFLVVAPLVTLGNWKREIETWTTMNCLVYHDSDGGADIRAFIREHEFYYQSEQYKRRGIYKFNVLVTSYQTLMADAEFLDCIHWRYIVIDEAHKLKNRDAKILQVLRNFTWDSCLLMTGTPLQNGVFELWCLLNFIEPEKFPSQQEFYDQYGDLNSAEQVAALHEQLRPYMLRRVKEDVEKSIPPKEETIIDVELTTLQKKYYRAIFERNRSFLNMGASGTVANLVNVEMELRKCCNHPFLIRGVEEKECGHLDEQLRTKILIQASGKTVLLDKLLSKFRAEKKKVLIFSQFKIMLDIIEDLCHLRGYLIERLDGSVRGNTRQAAIDRFNNPESETFAFLLSTRAGGVGINLIAASVVILYDSDWNPQNDLQAVARCHRIGQTQSVNIYRLVTKKTYEAQMFDIASKKLGMHHAVFETGGVRNEFDGEDDGSNMMSLMSLDREKVEMMIRYGAYAIMGENDEEDPENRAINEVDIDKLLSASRTIRYDPTRGEPVEVGEDGEPEGTGVQPTASQSSALSFSKASFTAESSDTTIDFNDEQFWEKVLGPKPVQVLMTKVQEGWLATASEEDIKGFLTELRELARSIVLERQRGGTMPDADQVMSILIELKVTGPVLKGVVNVRAVASDWLEVIEKPKRRRNQDAGSELMYLEFLDGVKSTAMTGGSKSKGNGARRRKPKGSAKGASIYRSDDEFEHFDEDEDTFSPARKPKKPRRPTPATSTKTGIRITIKVGSGDSKYVVEKIETTNKKLQKELVKPSEEEEEGASPNGSRKRKASERQGDADEEASGHSDSGDEDDAKVSSGVEKESDDDEAGDDNAEEEEEDDMEDEDDEDDDDSTKSPVNRRPERVRTMSSQSDPQEDEEMWCRVCYSDQGFLDDPIVQCEKCDVAVHKYCYGIEKVPEGDAPWYCDYCAEKPKDEKEADTANSEGKAPVEPPRCVLCPLKRTSSAYKKTVEGDWVHVVCALWAPGVQFTDVERMNGVKNVPQAIDEMKGYGCAICKEVDGCIKCCRQNCLLYFHPLCGRETKGKYDMFMSEAGQLRAYCPKHRSRARRMV